MKAIRIMTLALLLAVGVGAAASAQDTKAKTKAAKTETVVFEVGMHCANCQAKIEKHIPFEKGVKDMTVSLDNKTVEVTFDPRKTDAEKLRKAIEALGYTAKVRPAKAA